ncbi:MAG: ACT domain-containing protein, partial [Oscillospiraceae bacterium]
LEGLHENSVQITFWMDDGSRCVVIGSSIGGGQIVIRSIDGFATELTAQSATLIVTQYDRRGVVSEVTRVLAEYGLNIGVMKLSRRAKGDVACCVIETDGTVPEAVLARLRGLEHILRVRAID